MSGKVLGSFWLCLGLLLMMPSGWAQYGEEMTTATEDVEIGVRRQGVVHNIAGDRRVERVAGGLYEPEGLDIYLKRHIEQLAGQITHLETQVTEMKEDLRVIREAIIREEPKSVQADTLKAKKPQPTTLVS